MIFEKVGNVIREVDNTCYISKPFKMGMLEITKGITVSILKIMVGITMSVLWFAGSAFWFCFKWFCYGVSCFFGAVFDVMEATEEKMK